MIKKMYTLLAIVLLMFSLTSCYEEPVEVVNIKPQVSDMKSICELAVMECYYHNVAKFKEEDASGILLWKKDKHFWIEYSGIVKVGIDTSLIDIVVKDTTVMINIPEAQILGEKVDEASLVRSAFVVDKDSAEISGEDEIAAFAQAQENMVQAASQDSTLLASAQKRAQKLLEEYVDNIGEAIGVEYSIQWSYGEDGLAEVDNDPELEIKTDDEE